MVYLLFPVLGEAQVQSPVPMEEASATESSLNESRGEQIVSFIPYWFI